MKREFFNPLLLLCAMFSMVGTLYACSKDSTDDAKEPGTSAGGDATGIEIVQVTRSGDYRTDGSYRWNYKANLRLTEGTSGTFDLVVQTPGGFPFTVESLPASVTVENGIVGTNVEFGLLVPASYIKEPVDLTRYDISFTVRQGSAVRATWPLKISGPLPEHPRLMLRKEDLAQLRLNYAHSDFNDIKATYVSQRDYTTDGKVTSAKTDEKIRQKMEALALDYLLDPSSRQASAKTAIQVAINYLSSYTDRVTSSVEDNYSENVQACEAIIGASMVYDWCYDQLTDMNKTALQTYMKKMMALCEYGLPTWNVKQYLSGHYGENAPSMYLAMGIATFDEDSDLFFDALKEQVEGFAPSRNPMYASQTHHQGAQYIHVRGYHEMLQHLMLEKIGLSPYDDRIGLMTYRAVYGTIPQKGDMDGMCEGDAHNNVEMGNPQIYYLSSALTEDPYLQTMSRKKLIDGTFQSARLFVWHDPTKSARPLEGGLSTMKYFPSPSGMIIARTDWDMDATDYNSPVMVVLMNMREYSTQNHTHMDLGHFGIYYKGHLALDAGIYQGSDKGNGWGAENYINYYSRSIAHNTVLILDPNEPTPYAGWDKKAAARDGGQFFRARHAWDNSQEMFAAGKSATVLAAEIPAGSNPDYAYLKGDMTDAYNVPSTVESYPAKAECVRRSFVFLNHHASDVPGTLVVLDRIVARDASFRKTWLLHTQNEPQVNGTTLVATNTNGGRNGKLVNTVLLPEASNARIEIVGGSGKEYWVDGRNYGTVTQEDAGRYRIELSPRNAARGDNFLNVLQAMDASAPTPEGTISKAVSGDGKRVAVAVRDRIVIQSLALECEGDAFEISVGEPGTSYQVLVTDLESGTWTITTPSGSLSKTASEAGTVEFQSTGGTFSLVRR